MKNVTPEDRRLFIWLLRTTSPALTTTLTLSEN